MTLRLNLARTYRGCYNLYIPKVSDTPIPQRAGLKAI